MRNHTKEERAAYRKFISELFSESEIAQLTRQMVDDFNGMYVLVDDGDRQLKGKKLCGKCGEILYFWDHTGEVWEMGAVDKHICEATA